MAEIVHMPKLSDTMTEGVVSEWHKKIGDEVKNGDLLADIETDKATMEFESFQEGTLLYIGVEKGKAAPVDSILAIIGKKDEDISALLKEQSAVKPQKEELARMSDSSIPVPAKTQEQLASAPKLAPQPVVTESTHAPEAPPQLKPSLGKGLPLKASPLAKRLAKERHLNLSFIKGSGEGGRVIRRDIENFFGVAAPQFLREESYTDIPLSQMRKTIARRLTESKFTAPHFYLTMEIEMNEMSKAREVINEVAPEKISYNDIVIKAVAQALRAHPDVNVSWRGDTLRMNQHIHIGMAVAVEEGLLVPVIRFADTKTLSQIAHETKEYSKRAKEKKLQPADWEGNTFTISNLGMYGIESFTGIINLPDACLLAVGAIREGAVSRDGVITSEYLMKVTLSCDHRAVDGATGSLFLQTFKQLMENPVILLGMQNI
jgi:pyruvate dehydrogenase E2 component (dihydrolipoamide acetyltransferase)